MQFPVQHINRKFFFWVVILLPSVHMYGRGRRNRPLLFKNGLSWYTLHHVSRVWASVRKLTAFLNVINGVSNFNAQPARIIPTSQSISDQYKHACECMPATSHFPAQCPSCGAWFQSRAPNVEMKTPAAFWDDLLGLQKEMLAEKKKSIMLE